MQAPSNRIAKISFPPNYWKRNKAFFENKNYVSLEEIAQFVNIPNRPNVDNQPAVHSRFFFMLCMRLVLSMTFFSTQARANKDMTPDQKRH